MEGGAAGFSVGFHDSTKLDEDPILDVEKALGVFGMGFTGHDTEFP